MSKNILPWLFKYMTQLIFEPLVLFKKSSVFIYFCCDFFITQDRLNRDHNGCVSIGPYHPVPIKKTSYPSGYSYKVTGIESYVYPYPHG